MDFFFKVCVCVCVRACLCVMPAFSWHPVVLVSFSPSLPWALFYFEHFSGAVDKYELWWWVCCKTVRYECRVQTLHTNQSWMAAQTLHRHTVIMSLFRAAILFVPPAWQSVRGVLGVDMLPWPISNQWRIHLADVICSLDVCISGSGPPSYVVVYKFNIDLAWFHNEGFKWSNHSHLACSHPSSILFVYFRCSKCMCFNSPLCTGHPCKGGKLDITGPYYIYKGWMNDIRVFLGCC